MIFQGRAALGAYEAGTYQAIVQRLVKQNEDRKLKSSEDGDVQERLFQEGF